MRKQSGFSLVELVITLVIAAVLIGLAAPNMSIFLRNSARTTLLNDFVTGIQYARSQAITRNQRVTLCAVDIADRANDGADPFDSASPAGACLGTGVFETGWVVFVDNGTTVNDIDAGETILRIFPGADAGGGTFRGLEGDGDAVASLSYVGTGLIATDLDTNTHFKYCDDRTNPNKSARAVLVNASGQPKVSTDSDDDGTDNLTSALELGCP